MTHRYHLSEDYQPRNWSFMHPEPPASPPGRCPSLGGEFDYAGWPDCERFMELDRAIQLDARHDAEEKGCQRRAQ
jgi:hypothetical protein